MNRFALAAFAGFVGVVFASRVARAEEAPPPNDPPPFPTWRLALLPVVGGGLAAMTSKSTFPSFVGTSILGGEIDFGLERVGGFARVQFQSSGQGGRWTAMSYTLGGSYRVFGDGFASFGGVLRGGLSYEHWRASTGGCDVMLFFPASCKDFLPPPGSGVVNPGPARVDVSNDAFGLVGGFRLELPVQAFYFAIDGELGGAASVASGAPGGIVQLRVALVFGLRNRRSGDATIEPSFRPRPPRGATQ